MQRVYTNKGVHAGAGARAGVVLGHVPQELPSKMTEKVTEQVVDVKEEPYTAQGYNFMQARPAKPPVFRKGLEPPYYQGFTLF